VSLQITLIFLGYLVNVSNIKLHKNFLGRSRAESQSEREINGQNDRRTEGYGEFNRRFFEHVNLAKILQNVPHFKVCISEQEKYKNEDNI